MTPNQSPSCCPFCGAGIRIEKDGSQCRAPRGIWVGFECHTTWHQGYHDLRRLQSLPCILAERERLTRERDEALELAQRTAQKLSNMAFHAGQAEGQLVGALARVKRLEEALGLVLKMRNDWLEMQEDGYAGAYYAFVKGNSSKWEEIIKAKEAKP